MKSLILFFLLPVYTFANSYELVDIKPENIRSISVPQPTIENSDATDIKTYTSDEIFTFENEAKARAEKMSTILKDYGITVLGYNITEKGNDYSFNIEYLPLLKNPRMINSVLIKKYTPVSTYWNESLSKKAMENAIANFKNSPLKMIDAKTLENGSDYSFYILYSVNNVLKKSKSYYVTFEKFNYGIFTFENQAEKEINSAISSLNQMGIAAIKGKVIPSGNDYSIEIEYLNKTDYEEKKPEYSIETYKCMEKFPFEEQALKESISRNEIFSKAGLKPLHNYTYENDNDHSFAIDYIVKNIYKKESAYKEHLIKRYNNPSSFDFENEAKKAMLEKVNNFNSANLYVISSSTYEIGNSYTFYIEYIEKQNILN